jgi:beta-glucosidase
MTATPHSRSGRDAGAAQSGRLRFGVATAAYQIEGAVRDGGRGESIWDRFCRVPGAVANGDTGDVACDHYHRWRDDLDLMSVLNVESYRFSIAWPRVQPDGRGPVNGEGIGFYRRLVEGLLERGIEPVATLYHWDLPQARQDAGGWAARETAERFAEYAQLTAAALGDVVTRWITHNEPWVVAFAGHAHGTKAPGIRDWPTALRASHHLLLSHGLAVDAIRAEGGPDAEVGITLNLSPARPASESEDDEAAALRMDGHMNRWFLDPLLRGRYPEDMVDLFERHVGPLEGIEPGDAQIIARPIDFLGVNYYFPLTVRSDPPTAPLGAVSPRPPEPTTAMGWEVDAGGLYELLMRVTRDYGPLPVDITENGAAYPDSGPDGGIVDDPERVAYLEQHLAALERARAEGADVRRYYAWSLLDNFEWEHGYGMRFGIVHVDFETQRRVLKRSGLWYRDHIARARDGAAP